MKSESSSESNSPSTSAIKAGPAAVWMRRLANIGFGIAAVYCVYMIALLLLAMKKNSDFEGQPIGEFTLEQISSDRALVPLAFKGPSDTSRAVILWATWCGPCHSLLSDLRNQAAKGAVDPSRILAVSVGESLADVAAFLETSPMPFQIVLDRQGVLAQAMKLSGTPTVVLVGADGKIQSASTGGFGLASKIVDFLKTK